MWVHKSRGWGGDVRVRNGVLVLGLLQGLDEGMLGGYGRISRGM